MLHGLLTEHLPMTMHRDRRNDQTSHDAKFLDDVRKSGQHFAAPTFRLCLLGDGVLLGHVSSH